MRKSLFRLFYLFLLAGSCIVIDEGCTKGDHGNSPDNQGTDYYISFKVDGVQKKYTSQVAGSLGYSTQDKLYNGILQGYKDFSATEKSHIGIVIFDNVAITTGAYHDPQKANNVGGDNITKVMINYYDDTGNGYLSMGAMVDEDGNPLPGINGIVADAEVVITDLTSTMIKGTFSGTTFSSTDGASFKDKVVITEGKFILKRLQ